MVDMVESFPVAGGSHKYAPCRIGVKINTLFLAESVRARVSWNVPTAQYPAGNSSQDTQMQASPFRFISQWTARLSDTKRRRQGSVKPVTRHSGLSYGTKSVRLFGTTLLVLVASAMLGCNRSKDQPVPAAGAVDQSAASNSDTATTLATKPNPAPSWKDRLSAVEGLVEQGDFDEAQRQLTELRQTARSADDEQATQLSRVETAIEERLAARADAERERCLAEAQTALDERRLEAAQTALQQVLNAAPTASQREQAAALKLAIQERQKVRRDLAGAMQLLASSKRSEVRTAQNRLRDDAKDAFPLLCEALSSDNAVLVANALELLRLFNEPDRTFPQMVGVLARGNQRESWPAAIREIEKAAQPGAGGPLLELGLRGETPEVRSAALTALARVIDPPLGSLPALLPLIYADGAELPVALAAALHAVEIHHQHDLTTRRGFDLELTAEQEKLLSGLAVRLAALIGPGATERATGESPRAAMSLAVALRQIAPAPIKGIKVVRSSGEDPASPATAVVDGVWDSVDLGKLWRQPGVSPGSIVLDLGAEYTVAAVKIWNFNEPAGQHRGWKEIEIFVSDTPTLLEPIALGVVPAGPGVAAAGDYGVAITVPFVRGRYVKLQAKSVWRADGSSGLSEVEVLGF